MTENEQRLHQLAAHRKRIAFLGISISVAVLVGIGFDRFPPGAIALIWFSFATIIVRADFWLTPDEIASVTAGAGHSKHDAGQSVRHIQRKDCWRYCHSQVPSAA